MTRLKLCCCRASARRSTISAGAPIGPMPTDGARLTAQSVDQPRSAEQDRYLGNRRSQALEGGARLTIVPLEVHDDHVGPPVVAGELAKAVLNARDGAHVVMRTQSLLDEEGVRDVVLDQQNAHGSSFLRS